MSSLSAQQTTPLLWDQTLIARHDLSGPRYTSYPTAPQFSGAFTAADWHRAMARSNASGRPLSLYFHIPFCDTVCYYCGCNKIVTANKQRALPYLAALHKEIALHAAAVDVTRPVVQLHFGGGTPTYLSDEQLTELMADIRQQFDLASDAEGEFSIEIHPQTVTPERLAHLRQLGFNRLSLGIQDFNPAVQKAVNRFNSYAEVAELTQAARQLNYKALSMDLIYGLPLQTLASFSQTLNDIISLRPDRLSLFSYAHMPHLFKVQQQINSYELPAPDVKLQMLHMSIEQLQAAGYVYIGMDHFALPDDELTLAQAAGKLHRNFQGYATHGGCDLLAFGVSAINQLDKTYAQNAKDMPSYLHALDQNQLPLVRGIELTRDDAIRKAVISALICHFECNTATIEQQFHIQFAEYFAEELQGLKPLIAEHLVTLEGQKICVTPRGRLLIRRICMEFDAYLKPKAGEIKTIAYSKII